MTTRAKKTPLRTSKRKLTIKQRGFVKDYIETKNATEAVRRNYDVLDENTAGTIAVENLLKPAIDCAIKQALAIAGSTDTTVALIHTRNMVQDDNLNVSQTAVKDYYSVTGKLDKTSNTTPLQVAFIINTNKG